MQGDDNVYRISASKYISVVLCALLVASSLLAVYSAQYPPSGGMCYILPVYHNAYKISAYNSQSLENDSDSDIQWIKESANVYLQDWFQERLLPSPTPINNVAQYTAVAQRLIRGYSCNQGKMYHMLN